MRKEFDCRFVAIRSVDDSAEFAVYAVPAFFSGERNNREPNSENQNDYNDRQDYFFHFYIVTPVLITYSTKVCVYIA